MSSPTAPGSSVQAAFSILGADFRFSPTPECADPADESDENLMTLSLSQQPFETPAKSTQSGQLRGRVDTTDNPANHRDDAQISPLPNPIFDEDESKTGSKLRNL